MGGRYHRRYRAAAAVPSRQRALDVAAVRWTKHRRMQQ